MPDDSKKFSYTGISAGGQRTAGEIYASDIREAETILKKMGTEIISVQEKKFQGVPLFGALMRRRRRIKPANILHFTRYLTTMLAAGLPIVQALDIIGKDRENPEMQKLVNSIRAGVTEGKTLSESFAKYPQHFSELYCNLIQAGEKSGTLEKILGRLAGYLERTEMLKKKVKKAMIYPVAILSIALGVSLILLIFVVPQFQKMFESYGKQLPLFTRMVVHLSEFLQHEWWVLALVVAAGVYAFRRAKKTSESFNVALDKMTLRIHIIGDIQKKSIIARFTRTLGTTLEAGMPIVESMKSMAEIVGNRVYRDTIIRLAGEVASGRPLSDSMEASGQFPNMVIQMISVGEASGRLVDMLNHVADYYEEEVNGIVDNLSSLLEPLIMVVLGVLVGGFVVAMYLPIFKIGSLF